MKAPRLNLIIAGAQRSATTSLKAALNASPNIRFVSNREENLSHGGRYVGFPFASPFASWSEIGLRDGGAVYETMTDGRPAKYHGTKWPYFMVFPHIACNLRMQLPDARIIFILRNPTDCLWSSFLKRHDGKSDPADDFDRWVEEGCDRIAAAATPEHRSSWAHMLYADSNPAIALDRGHYFPQVVNFLHLFGWHQLFIVNYRDFATEPRAEMARLFQWLEVEPPGEIEGLGERHNSTSSHVGETRGRRVMHESTRARLHRFYQPSDERLCDMMSWDLEGWRS